MGMKMETKSSKIEVRELVTEKPLKTITISKAGRVVIIQLNRPKALNALNSDMLRELTNVMCNLDKNPKVGCFILTGSDRAFAAGADIKELQSKSYMDMFHEDFLSGWETIANLRTPKIAAVSGYALGGGCELAMMCDMIFASKTAKFGQPEIKLGLIPGMGGSQRLTKLVGKAKAMDMILTGRMMDVEEAERSGLVARVFESEALLDETLKVAQEIAGFSKTTAMIAREAVNQALEVSLQDGLQFERRTYHALWATHDAKEGMQAFIDKRDAEFERR